MVYSVRISKAGRCGPEQTKAPVPARPAGSLVRTQRTGTVTPCEFHSGVPLATPASRSVEPSFARQPGTVMRAPFVAFLTARVLGVS
jgi:hypothetical protein